MQVILLFINSKQGKDIDNFTKSRMKCDKLNKSDNCSTMK